MGHHQRTTAMATHSVLPTLIPPTHYSIHTYKCSHMHTRAYQCFSDGVVCILQIQQQLCHDVLGIGVITHSVQKVDGSLTNTDVSLRLNTTRSCCIITQSGLPAYNTQGKWHGGTCTYSAHYEYSTSIPTSVFIFICFL